MVQVYEPWTTKLLRADHSLYTLCHEALLPDIVFKLYIPHTQATTRVSMYKSQLGK